MLRLAFLTESPADEAVLHVLVERVLGERFVPVQAGLRARGWPNVAQLLPAVLRHLHFNTDADALVVLVDADDSVIHHPAHDAPDVFHPGCRLCQLRNLHARVARRLPPARGRAHPLRCTGVAVPAIEAWLLSGRAADVTEAAWVAGREAGAAPYTRRQLKELVYGTDRPSLGHEIACARRELARQGPDVRRLEHDFPGFAVLAADLRAAFKTAKRP